MNMVKKRRKLKKWVYFLLGFIICLIVGWIGCLLILNIITPKDTGEENITFNKEELISQLLSNISDDKLSKEFWEFIHLEYGKDSLEKLLSLSFTYEEEIFHQVTGNSLKVLLDLYQGGYVDDDNVKIISSDESILRFVGDISLADNFDIMPYYDSRGEGIYGILDEDVVNLMNSASVMVVNNEFAFSDRGSPLPNKYYTFRGSPSRVSIYDEMGVDLVTLANNHVYDFGEEAFIDTLDTLKKADIPYVGAGRNLEETMRPYYIILNGYKIAFVNATRAEKYILTPEATENSAGVLRCYDTTLFEQVIKEADSNSDYVVALVHWGTEFSHELEEVQISSGKLYIDSGADIVVGSHAHTLQGIEFYNGKPIVYNLGNFIFNKQSVDTGILEISFEDLNEITYSFIPCYQSNRKTVLLNGEEKERVLNSMREWSNGVIFEDTGIFYEK